MIKPTHLRQALRIFGKSIKRRLFGTEKYNGNAEEICRQIVKKCWNGSYFLTSAGHFCEFYCRDFGWCAESLIKLGYEKEVEKTLDYALGIFSKKGGIKTTITPYDEPIDIYHYSPDSLGFILRTISLLKNKKIAEKYKEFLNSEIKKFHDFVIDSKTGLVRKDRQFSSMKDYSKRQSSCYDNVMVWVVHDSLNKIKILDSPFKKYDFKNLVKENFWNGKYFLDDLSGKDYVSGDSNVFPFWTGMFDDKKMINTAIEAIQREGLDMPLPLSYTSQKVKTKRLFHGFVVANYEQSTIWAHIGPLLIEVIAKIDKQKAREYLLKYKETIERYGNYLELFERNLTPYRTPFYYSDESMLWAANYLALSKKLGI
jgi:hypothetical protein